MNKNKSKTREEIARILSAWRSSGLTQRKYCEQTQLSKATFASWIRKERRQVDGTASGIVPLRIEGKPSSITLGMEIEYPNGVRLRLPAMPSAETLRRLIQIQ